MRGDGGCPYPWPASRSPRRRRARTSPNSYFCLLFVSLRGPVAGGTRAAVPAPARTAPLGRGRAAASSRPSGVAWTRFPPHRPGGAFVFAPLWWLYGSLSPSESFAAGTRPRCAGRRAAEAAGWGAPGRVGLPAANPSSGPGRTRLPPPMPLRYSGRSARRTGATFPLRLNSERGALAPHRPSFPCPPSPSLPCLHHPQAKYCYFAAPNLVPFEYIIYFL